MSAVTLSQISEQLKQLPPEKLPVVLDFVSYLADRYRSGRNSAAEPELAEWGMSEYRTDLEDYENRLARGEIKWQ